MITIIINLPLHQILLPHNIFLYFISRMQHFFQILQESLHLNRTKTTRDWEKGTRMLKTVESRLVQT